MVVLEPSRQQHITENRNGPKYTMVLVKHNVCLWISMRNWVTVDQILYAIANYTKRSIKLSYNKNFGQILPLRYRYNQQSLSHKAIFRFLEADSLRKYDYINNSKNKCLIKKSLWWNEVKKKQYWDIPSWSLLEAVLFSFRGKSAIVLPENVLYYSVTSGTG